MAWEHSAQDYSQSAAGIILNHPHQTVSIGLELFSYENTYIILLSGRGAAALVAGAQVAVAHIEMPHDTAECGLSATAEAQVVVCIEIDHVAAAGNQAVGARLQMTNVGAEDGFGAAACDQVAGVGRVRASAGGRGKTGL